MIPAEFSFAHVCNLCSLSKFTVWFLHLSPASIYSLFTYCTSQNMLNICLLHRYYYTIIMIYDRQTTRNAPRTHTLHVSVYDAGLYVYLMSATMWAKMLSKYVRMQVQLFDVCGKSIRLNVEQALTFTYYCLQFQGELFSFAFGSRLVWYLLACETYTLCQRANLFGRSYCIILHCYTIYIYIYIMYNVLICSPRCISIVGTWLYVQ